MLPIPDIVTRRGVADKSWLYWLGRISNISVAVVSLVSQDGETHWLEGALLLAVFFILALAFYHLPVE